MSPNEARVAPPSRPVPIASLSEFFRYALVRSLRSPNFVSVLAGSLFAGHLLVRSLFRDHFDHSEFNNEVLIREIKIHLTRLLLD